MHPLLAKLHAIRRVALRRVLFRASAFSVCLFLCSGLVFGVLDVRYRWESAMARWAFSLAFLLILVWGAWRCFALLLRFRWTVLVVAQNLERVIPSLRDRLASAVSLLESPVQLESSGGSNLASSQLADGLVQETAAEFERVDVQAIWDPIPLRRSAFLMIFVLLASGVAFCSDPQRGALAFRRLVTPWENLPWPQEHQLQFVDMPMKLSMGDDLRFVVQDASGRLPSSVQLWLKEEGETETIEKWSMVRDGKQFFLERKNLVRAFQYRAVGGDHESMSWRAVAVVTPARVQSAEAKLSPPAYTGWLSKSVTMMPSRLRVLAGTKIVLAGSSDRPLANVQLIHNQDEEEFIYRGLVGKDSTSFRVPAFGDRWQPESSGEYQLKLKCTDTTVSNQEEVWPIQVVADRPPTISQIDALAYPWITPNACLNLQFAAEDDLRVRRVTFHHSVLDGSFDSEQKTELYQGPAEAPVSDYPDNWQFEADRLEVAHRLSVGDLSLAVGSEFNYFVVVEDYLGLRTQSLAQALLVVTEAEIIGRVGSLHSSVLAKLQGRLNQQRKNLELIESVRKSLASASIITQALVDQLHAGILHQSRINADLVGSEAPIPTELESLQRLLKRSQLTNHPTYGTVSKQLSKLKELGQRHFRPALTAMQQAEHAMRARRDLGKSDTTAQINKSLLASYEHHLNAVKELQGLMEEMSSWEDYQRISQELQELAQRQERIRAQTREMARQLLSTEQAELERRERSRLQAIATEQRELARDAERSFEGLDLVRARMSLQHTSLADSFVPEGLDAALRLVGEGAVAWRMRQIAKMIDNRRLGTASDGQAEMKRVLDEVMNQLSLQGVSRQTGQNAPPMTRNANEYQTRAKSKVSEEDQEVSDMPANDASDITRQLVLLRELQRNINTKTRNADGLDRSDADRQGLLKQLADQQGNVADSLSQLLKQLITQDISGPSDGRSAGQVLDEPTEQNEVERIGSQHGEGRD